MSKSEKYYIDKSQTLRKAIIIYKIEGSVHSPIMYLKKPKWVNDTEFTEFLNNIEIIIKEK